VHYATLLAIVTRILYHLPDVAQFNLTKTRVGVIKRGSVAIANIVTLPLVSQATISSDAVPVVGVDETLDITNATAWEMALGSDDVMLTTLRVNAITTRKQPFDPLILDYFNATVPSVDDLSKVASVKRDDVAIGPERMLFYEIDRDMLYITIRVYENPNEDIVVRNSSITEFPSLLLSCVVAVGIVERAIEDLSDLVPPSNVRVAKLTQATSSTFVSYYPLGRATVKLSMTFHDLPVGTVAQWGYAGCYDHVIDVLEQVTREHKRRDLVPNVQGQVWVETFDEAGNGVSTRIGEYEITAMEV